MNPLPLKRTRCSLLAATLCLLGPGTIAVTGQNDHATPAPVAPASPAATARGVLGRRIEAARPGETIPIEPGVYREHLRIDRPVTLEARGDVIIDGSGSGDIIEIVAPGVTLRGLTIRNTGIDLDKENAAIRVLAPRATIEGCTLNDILFGIDLREAPDSRIVRNSIGGKALDIARRGDGLRLWRSSGTLIEGNTIHDGRDAILWYSTGVVVRNNRGFDCRYGLHLMFSDDVTIVGNEFSRNSVGIYLMYSTGVELVGNRLIRNRGPSGYGIGLKETDRFSVRGNLIAGNRAGVYIDGSPFTRARPGEFTGNTFAFNDIGITFLPSAKGNELAENNFIDNIEQVAVAGRGNLDANRFWRGDRGNFWSDYTGYDRNGDGVGDFVHESCTIFDNLMDTEPSLRLFLFSPAQQAIEFVGRAVPAVRPEPKFCDEVPLMRAVDAGAGPVVAVHPARLRALLALSGAALAFVGVSLILVAQPWPGGGVGRARSPHRRAAGAAA